MDNSGLVVAVLMATVVLRVLIVAAAVWWLIPSRLVCPHCSEETAAVRVPRAVSLLGLQLRWCLACGWSGLAKRRRVPRAVVSIVPTSARSTSS